MSIIRVKKDKDYSVISNTPINDNNLSAESLGVMTYLLSKPDGWIIQNKEVRHRFSFGRDKLTRIFNELESAGYLDRRKLRGDKGRWQWDSTLREYPINRTTIDVFTDNGSPNVGSPNVGSPNVGKHVDIVSTESVSTELINTDIVNTEESASPQNLAYEILIKEIQSLVGWNPLINGNIPITAKQLKRLNLLCNWLIKECRVTYVQIEQALNYFKGWMKTPPTPEQVKEHWSKIVNAEQKKPKTDIAPGLAEKLAAAF